MTLYWYMHWFWITCQCYVCLCDETLHSTTQSSAVKLTVFPVTDETLRAPKVIGGFGIPSIVSPASAILNSTTYIKLRKSVNVVSENHTRKMNSTTVPPPVKKTTVIDLNTADLSLNFTDNQTVINARFNVIERTDNLTNFENDKHVNKSVIFNSKQFGTDRTQSVDNLSAAGITGITLGCVSVVGFISAVSYILYKNRGFNRPQVLNDHCSNLDSSGYIDDTSVRDNSEEMYSLDNDSFLNSLEAMTIQNYWTDTVKHTKL